MESATIKKIIIIASTLILILLLAVGCNFLTRDDENPNVSNPDAMFFTLGDVSINRGQIYNHAKMLEGMSHLLNYVDEKLLEDYLDGITEEAVERELKVIRYGTDDPAIIEEIEMDEEQLEKVEQNFYVTIAYAGFDPDNPAEIDRFIRLTLAKKAVAREAFVDTLGDELEERLEAYYNNVHLGEATALQIVFSSTSEFTNVMNRFNLVPNFESGLGLYEGDTPIEDVASEDIADDTRKLSDEEVFEYYVLMYNYMYQYRPQLDETITSDDLDAFDSDFFKFTYHDMIDSVNTVHNAGLIFNLLRLESELDEDEEGLPYTINRQRYIHNDDAQKLRDLASKYVMTYKLDVESAVDFEAIDEETYDEILEDFLTASVRGQDIEDYMIRYRYEENFVIHDTHLHASYEQMAGEQRAVYEKSDGDIVASLDGFDVTVDDYFDYMMRRIGALMAIELYKEGYLLNSEYFENRYGSNRDLPNSRNAEVREVIEEINMMKLQFASSQYASFFSWSEYLFLAYGFETDEDFLKFILLTEIMDYLVPENFDYNRAHDYVSDHYENYISLDIEHILIYVDFDGDLTLDDYDDYLDGLSDAELTEYNTLKGRLENALQDAAEDDDLKDIVTEYVNALRDEDDNDWAEFKNFGFKLRHEDLSIVNYSRADLFVDEFKDALYDIYNAYSLDEYKDDDNYLHNLVTTEFGLHLINASKPESIPFEIPSAAFDDSAYDSALQNSNDIPTVGQLEYFATYAFELRMYGETDLSIDDDLYDALNVLFGVYYQRHFRSAEDNFDPFGNYAVVQKLLDGNVEFADNNARFHTMLEALKEVYDMIIFP